MFKTMHIIKYIFISLMFIGGIIKTNAQVLTVKASVDTNIILIGDQVNFYFDVNQPKDLKINFPFITDTLANKIEVLQDMGKDTFPSQDANQINIRQKYLITSFDSGIYVIPSYNFTFQSLMKAGEDTIATIPLYFGVQTMAMDTAHPDQIADIKLPIKAPLTFREILPYALIGYFILFIISFLVYYFEKRKKNEPVFARKIKPKEPPHIIAYRNLDRLRNEKLWQKNMVKKFHSVLTETIRRYIEDRFFVDAMEKTSNELLISLKENKLLDSILFEKVEKMLKLADLVKFAKHIPLADENELSLKDAYYFVDKTKQVFVHNEQETVKTNENTTEVSDEKSIKIDDTEVKALSESNLSKEDLKNE
ncbi:MAG: hypothetical protein GXO79_04135 [Chlorobi bacterium]|nr:hypothetical protein [Chlorobiota bacterium]